MNTLDTTELREDIEHIFFLSKPNSMDEIVDEIISLINKREALLKKEFEEEVIGELEDEAEYKDSMLKSAVIRCNIVRLEMKKKLKEI